MIVREPVKDWRGKILGFIETDTQTGNKKIKDFYGKIKEMAHNANLIKERTPSLWIIISNFYLGLQTLI